MVLSNLSYNGSVDTRIAGISGEIVSAALFSVQDKSILITGATGSLGSAAARALAEAGARLTLAGGNAARLSELVGEAGIRDVAVVTRRPDTPDDAQAMVDAAVAKHGRLDGVLVASGMNHVAAHHRDGRRRFRRR